MKVLQTIQEDVSFLIIRDDVTDSRSKCLNIFSNIMVYFSYSVGSMLLTAFLFFEANTFDEYSDAFYPLATIGVGIFNWSVYVRNKNTIFGLIDNFDRMIDTRKFTKHLKMNSSLYSLEQDWTEFSPTNIHSPPGLKNPVSKAIYEEMNAFVEKWSKIIYFVSMRITFPCVTIPYAIWSYIQYFTTDLGPDAFHLPFPFWYYHSFISFWKDQNWKYCCYFFLFQRTPFDRRNPIAYFICFLFEIPPIFYSTVQAACNVSVPAAVCCIMIAFANDIIEEMADLNQLSKMNTSDARIYNKLCHIIRFHSTIKQLNWNHVQS